MFVGLGWFVSLEEGGVCVKHFGGPSPHACPPHIKVGEKPLMNLGMLDFFALYEDYKINTSG